MTQLNILPFLDKLIIFSNQVPELKVWLNDVLQIFSMRKRGRTPLQIFLLLVQLLLGRFVILNLMFILSQDAYILTVKFSHIEGVYFETDVFEWRKSLSLKTWNFISEFLLKVKSFLVQPFFVSIDLEGEFLIGKSAQICRPHNIKLSGEAIDLKHVHDICIVVLDIFFDGRKL